MFVYTAITTQFTQVSTTPGTIDITGNVYRIVPRSATDPFFTEPSFTGGGRWNDPGSFHVLHTGSSVQVVWAYANWHATQYGLPASQLPVEEQPDLLVLNYTARVADLVTDSGLNYYGLPVSYPVGYQGVSRYAETRSIGRAIFDAGLPGIACRSAQLTSWDGPIGASAEVAVFTGQSPPPALAARLAFSDWYPYV